jgi:hypothetical protein
MDKLPVDYFGVNETASRVYSRLRGSESSKLDPRRVDLKSDNERTFREGEVTDYLLFEGNLIHFGVYGDNKVWVSVEPANEGRLGINRQDLRNYLGEPCRKKGAGLVSNGRLLDDSPRELRVVFDIRGKNKDQMFDIFWHRFKPILRAIRES